MTFEVAIGDRVRTVAVVRKGGLLHVDLDGTTHVVDARRVGDSIVSMLVQLDSGRGPRSVDAAFAAKPTPGDFDVHLDGRTILDVNGDSVAPASIAKITNRLVIVFPFMVLSSILVITFFLLVHAEANVEIANVRFTT